MKKKINYFLIIILILFISFDNVSAIERTCVICGTGTYPIPSLLPKFVSKIFTLVQIGVPIVLIVVGMVNYLKAVMSGDEKVMMDTNRKFIRSIIAGVIIFLVFAIVKFAFTTLDKAKGEGETTSCIDCFITGNCKGVSCSDSRGNSSQSPSQYTNKEDCEAVGYTWSLVIPEKEERCH